LKTEFAAFDKEGNGIIKARDLTKLVRCIGLNPSKKECEEYYERCAKGITGGDRDSFVQFLFLYGFFTVIAKLLGQIFVYGLAWSTANGPKYMLRLLAQLAFVLS